MQKIELNISSLSYSQSQSSAYALILDEKKGNRRLPIIIGRLEAQSIAIEVEKMKPARPLTHDLFKNFAKAYGITINEIIINKFSEGIFYSSIVCFDGCNEIQLDSRASDAVAIALRFNCPIYAYESVMNSAGLVMEIQDEMDTETEPIKKEKKNELEIFNLKELKETLQNAIDNEEYEKASLVRDEIDRRKNK